MTETTKEIFSKYEIRKSKKQKQAFQNYILSYSEEQGYRAKVEKSSFGAQNIVVGDIEKAKVVYTAHYDTCPALPFPNFITPKNFGIYLLYQIAIIFAIFMVLIPAYIVLGLFGQFVIEKLVTDAVISDIIYDLFYWIIWFVFMYILLAGPANKHTANDNTSGVTTLLDIMTFLPESQRERVAFVFFDLEEMGLLGSMGFASKHKKEMKEKPLINFDCVSDGENILFTVRKKAQHLVTALSSAFPSKEDMHVEIVTKGVFYPSDQTNFNQGVGVAALKKSKKFGFLYMNRIHTKKDTVYREENIEFLRNGAIKFVELL